MLNASRDPQDNERQIWLLLAHGFNMDGRAASQTVTDKIPHLLNRGITPIVISAKTGRKDSVLEHYQLFPIGPTALRFDVRHVMRKRWGKDWRYRVVSLFMSVFLVPLIALRRLVWPAETQWSWWWPAARKGLQIAASRHVDVIYSSGGAYSAHIAAGQIKRRTNLPWIAEIHDPMVVPGTTPDNRRKRIQAEVEEMICREADLVFWFTQPALRAARTRHPELGRRGRTLLPGVDPPTEELPAYKPGQKMVIGHFGSLSPTRSLADFIYAVERFTAFNDEARTSIELHIYGTALDPDTEAAIKDVGERVTVKAFGRLETDPTTGKSGRQRVLERMRTVDVLLLHHGVEPTCREYIPSKLYEYLWMQRPLLALVHQNAQLESMLRDFGHVVVPASDGVAQTRALGELYLRWRNSGLPDNGLASPYTTGAAVEQLLEWVESIRDQKASGG